MNHGWMETDMHCTMHVDEPSLKMMCDVEAVKVRTEEEIERLFSRLTHVNKAMRKKASQFIIRDSE